MNLKEILSRRKIKQVELSKATGINVSQINLFVNGWVKLPDRHIERIGLFLGINKQDVLDAYFEGEA